MSSELPPPPTGPLGALLDSWSEPSDVEHLASEPPTISQPPVMPAPERMDAPEPHLSAAPIPTLPSLPSLSVTATEATGAPASAAFPTPRPDIPLVPALPVPTLTEPPAPVALPQAGAVSAPMPGPAPAPAPDPSPAPAATPMPTVETMVVASPMPPTLPLAPTPLVDHATTVTEAPTLAPASGHEVAPSPVIVEAPPTAPTIPSTPTITLPAVAAAPSAGVARSAAQMAAIEAVQSATQSPAKARQTPQRSLPGRILRTGFIAILIAGLGAGARFGYDYYENGRIEAEADTATSGTGFLAPVGSGLPTMAMPAPSGLFIDMTFDFVTPQDAYLGGDTTAPGDTPSFTNRTRYNLTGTRLTEDYQDAEGGYLLDVRFDKVLIKLDGQDSWFDRSGTEEGEALVESAVPFHGFIPMFHDFVPVEAIPYATVVGETVEQLLVVPLTPPVEEATELAAGDDDDRLSVVELQEADEVVQPLNVADVLPAAPPRPVGPVTVRHYTLVLDEAGFAAAHPHVHARWADSVGDELLEDGELDVWVDDFGVIRQFRAVTAQGTYTFTLNDVADALPGFQNSALFASSILQEAGE